VAGAGAGAGAEFDAKSQGPDADAKMKKELRDSISGGGTPATATAHPAESLKHMKMKTRGDTSGIGIGLDRTVTGTEASLHPLGSVEGALAPIDHASLLARGARSRRAVGLPVYGEGWDRDSDRGRWVRRAAAAAEETRRLTALAGSANMPSTAGAAVARAWRLAWAECTRSQQRNLVVAPALIRSAIESFASVLPAWLGGGSSGGWLGVDGAAGPGEQFGANLETESGVSGHHQNGFTIDMFRKRESRGAELGEVNAKRLLRSPGVLRLCGLIVHLCRARCVPWMHADGMDEEGQGKGDGRDALGMSRLKEAVASPRLKEAVASPRLKEAVASPRLKEAVASPRLKEAVAS